MTVGLVVVSHSRKIAEGAVELAAQMAPDVKFYAVGGTDDGRIGTDLEKAIAAFEAGLAEASGDGVVVLTDLGSAVMTAESAAEFCSEPDKGPPCRRSVGGGPGCRGGGHPRWCLGGRSEGRRGGGSIRSGARF